MPAYEHLVIRYQRMGGSLFNGVTKVWTINATPITDMEWNTLHTTLDDLSAEGWEIVSQSSALGFPGDSWERQEEFVLIMRRPKPE